jgi:hypothetical protein
MQTTGRPGTTSEGSSPRESARAYILDVARLIERSAKSGVKIRWATPEAGIQAAASLTVDETRLGALVGEGEFYLWSVEPFTENLPARYGDSMIRVDHDEDDRLCFQQPVQRQPDEQAIGLFLRALTSGVDPHGYVGSMVPDWLAKRELSPHAKLAYGYLARRWNESERCAYPSQRNIAEVLGLKSRQVRYLIRELCDLKLICTKQLSIQPAGWKKPRVKTCYVFLSHKWMFGSKKIAKGRQKAAAEDY